MSFCRKSPVQSRLQYALCSLLLVEGSARPRWAATLPGKWLLLFLWVLWVRSLGTNAFCSDAGGNRLSTQVYLTFLGISAISLLIIRYMILRRRYPGTHLRDKTIDASVRFPVFFFGVVMSINAIELVVFAYRGMEGQKPGLCAGVLLAGIHFVVIALGGMGLALGTRPYKYTVRKRISKKGPRKIKPGP